MITTIFERPLLAWTKIAYRWDRSKSADTSPIQRAPRARPNISRRQKPTSVFLTGATRLRTCECCPAKEKQNITDIVRAPLTPSPTGQPTKNDKSRAPVVPGCHHRPNNAVVCKAVSPINANSCRREASLCIRPGRQNRVYSHSPKRKRASPQRL